MWYDPPVFARGVAHDIDAQSGLLPGWEQEYRQLSCGRFSGSVAAASSSRISVIRETTNLSLHQNITAPTSKVVFSIPMKSYEPSYLDGRKIDHNTLFIIDGGKAYDLCTNGNTELVGVVFERDFLNERAEEKDSLLVNQAISKKVIQLPPEVAPFLQQFFEMLSRIMQRNDDTWPDTMPLTLLAETAFNNIWFALNHTEPGALPSGNPPRTIERQRQMVKHAVNFMQTHLADEISMEDVCTATHVSRRTLQYYFHNCLQISPQQYLKALRLNTARKMLRTPAPHSCCRARNQTIADIAAACGYGHASRFAGDFKLQFGVLPSEAAAHKS